MPSTKIATRYAMIFLAGAMLAACANQREPAQKMINDIEAVVNTASADAARYVPDQLIGVQTKLGDLKASFARGDYKYVVQAAPAVMGEAQGLASAIAAKKAEVARELNDQWTSLSTVMPGLMIAIQNRIDLLGKKSNRKLAKGIDLDAAKSTLGDASSLWSKAQGAFGNGNMDEAVTAAKEVKAKLADLATSLKMDLAVPAAAP